MRVHLDAFGKDYRSVEVEPKIECLLDLSVQNKPPAPVKKGFFYPLLPHKEQDHQRFRLESSGKRRAPPGLYGSFRSLQAN